MKQNEETKVLREEVKTLKAQKKGIGLQVKRSFFGVNTGSKSKIP